MIAAGVSRGATIKDQLTAAGPVAFGAGRPAIRRREPAGRWQQYCHRRGCSRAGHGYTLLMVDGSPAINATFYKNLNFNFIRDMIPVASVIRAPFVMEVPLSFPAATVAEFITLAKANPGKINMASGGSGTSTHVAGELFKMMTGTNLQHVPYRGGAPAIADLLGGQVQVFFGPIPESIEHIRAGKLRPLAVTAATRSVILPDIPTVTEFVPGYEASQFFGFVAPKNTPVEIVEKLNREINAGLANPTLNAGLADFGGIALVGSPADFGKLITEETEKWGKVIRAANIKAQAP
jgi:tripartite-type tricarboxylate transporter receptor subunit TctC